VVTREDILEAALKAFARHGYDGMSMRELTRTMGVSHGLLHHYFDSKYDLWKACIDHRFGGLTGELLLLLRDSAAQPDPSQALREVIIALVTLSSQFPSFTAILIQEGSVGGERLDYILDTHFADLLVTGRALVNRAIEQKLFRPIPWSTLIFSTFMGSISVFALAPMVQRMDDADPLAPEAVRQHAEALADMLMFGLLNRK